MNRRPATPTEAWDAFHEALKVVGNLLLDRSRSFLDWVIAKLNR